MIYVSDFVIYSIEMIPMCIYIYIYEGRSKTPSSSFSLWPRLLKETLGQVCEKARVAQERARASARRKVIPQLLVLNEFKMQAI